MKHLARSNQLDLPKIVSAYAIRISILSLASLPYSVPHAINRKEKNLPFFFGRQYKQIGTIFCTKLAFNQMSRMVFISRDARYSMYWIDAGLFLDANESGRITYPRYLPICVPRTNKKRSSLICHLWYLLRTTGQHSHFPLPFAISFIVFLGFLSRPCCVSLSFSWQQSLIP